MFSKSRLTMHMSFFSGTNLGKFCNKAQFSTSWLLQILYWSCLSPYGNVVRFCWKPLLLVSHCSITRNVCWFVLVFGGENESAGVFLSLAGGWWVSSGKCRSDRLGCKCSELSTLHLHVELICPGLWAGAARPGCLLHPTESSLGDLGTGAGSSAGAPSLQTAAARPGKDGCHSPAFLSVGSHPVLRRARDTRETQVAPSVTAHFFFCAVLCRHSKASCLAREVELPPGSFLSSSLRFPLGGAMERGGDRSTPGSFWQGAVSSHKAHQDPGALVSARASCRPDRACETKM